MGIKCSIFGHRFDDPTVERDREERGSEVVVTITETETCTRCGTERVVSENTEVTTLEAGESLESDADSPADDAIANDPSPDDVSSAETPSTDADPSGGGIIADAEGGDAAEIVDDGADDRPSGDRPAGDRPADGRPIAEDTADEPPTEDSVHPTADAGGGPVEDTDPETDDGVILEDDPDDATDEREPGQWPDEDDGRDPAAEAADEALADSLVEPAEDDGEGPAPGGSVPEGTFVCEECGFTTDIESSSLREGDFCPECHRGSLTAGPAE